MTKPTNGVGDHTSSGWGTQLSPPLLALGLGVAYAALALAMSFVTSFGSGASFWPAAGLTLAALVSTPRRYWPWLLAAVFLAELGVDLHLGYPLHLSAGWASANVVEPLLSALLLARLRGPRPRLDLASMPGLLTFLGAAVLAGPALGALVGALTAETAGLYDFGINWVRWLVGDGLGVLVVAPALLALTDRRERTPSLQPGLLAVVLVIAVVSFGPFAVLRQETTAYFVFPALLWLAVRSGRRGGALGVLLVSVLTNTATAMGWGAFAEGQGTVSGLVNAQLFLGTMAFSVLTVSVLTADLVRRDLVEAQLRHQAGHDALTGLRNRHSVIDLPEAGSGAGGPDRPVGYLVVDLDGFKAVNDTFGHAVGDAVLVETARRLQHETRDGDVVARVGGDEFLVRLDRPVSPVEIDSLAARLRYAVEQSITVDGHEVMVGASVGTAIGRAGGGSDALLRQADADMYAMKRARRGARTR